MIQRNQTRKMNLLRALQNNRPSFVDKEELEEALKSNKKIGNKNRETILEKNRQKIAAMIKARP